MFILTHFFFNDTATTEIYTLSLHDALPIWRDPRKQFETFAFDESVSKMKDLQIGMQLPGIVTNVTNFGAFVDVGVHQDGLVHISELADKFVKDPTTVVKVHQKVKVTVTNIDIPRKRIALSMRTKRDEKLT